MANKVVEILRSRYGGRSYSEKALSEEIVADLMEAARLTPSCFNKQPWRFLFLESPEALEKGRQVLAPGNQDWANRAPLLIIGYANPDDDCRLADGRDYYQFDLGMAVMNLMMVATEHDLAARPMAGYSPEKATRFFDIEEANDVLIVIAVGYIQEDKSHLPDKYKGKAALPRERMESSDIIKRL